MPLIQILITLLFVGLVLWICQQVGVDPAIMRIIRGVAIFFVVVWLLYWLIPYLGLDRFALPPPHRR
jgi:hypothetical protein